MKRKMIAGLTALALCLPLAAQAAPAKNTPAAPAPTVITAASAQQAALAAKDGTVTFALTVSGGEAAVELPVTVLSQTMAQDTALQRVKLTGDHWSLVLDRAAITALAGQAGTAATLRVVETTAQGKPTWQVSCVAGKDTAISRLNGGSYTFFGAYRPAFGENPDYLVAQEQVGEDFETVKLSAWRLGELAFQCDRFGTFRVALSGVEFNDIGEHWAQGDINFVAARGIVVGMGDNCFLPHSAVSWGMAVTMLGRMAGIEDPVCGHWYAAHLLWAKQNGLADWGQEAGEVIERQEMASLLSGYLGLQGHGPVGEYTQKVTYKDQLAIGSKYLLAIDHLWELNLMRGRANGTFDPQGSLTRGELAALLRRLVEWQLFSA